MDGSTRLVRSSLSIVLVVSMFFGAALVAGSTLEAQVTWSVVDSVPSSPNGTGTPYDPMLLADMTGDGRDDLILIAQDLVQVLSKENGTYTLVGSVIAPGSTGGGVPIAPPGGFFSGQSQAADLDGDDDLDLLISTWNGTVLVWNDGTGGLTLGTSLPGTFGGEAILVGDFNGDGNPDLASTAAGGIIMIGLPGITIYFGDGLGGFSAGTPLSIPNVNVASAFALDLDENGRDDFVFSGFAELTFAFTAPDGTIASTTTFPAGAGDAPQDIDAVDMNGDGHLDLIFTCPVMFRIGVMLLPGTGGFGLFSDHGVTGYPLGVDAIDVSGDAIPDLLVNTVEGLEYLVANGTGGFAPAITVPLPSPGLNIAIGDVNNDGLGDYTAHLGATVDVFENTTIEVEKFCRGDSTGDDQVNLADAVKILSYLFSTVGDDIGCMDSADTNDDGSVNVGDAVHLLGYLFVPGADPIPAPGVSTCGADPSNDPLDCPTSACP